MCYNKSMAIEKPTQNNLCLLPPPDHKDREWMQGHGGPRSIDYNYEDEMPDDRDAMPNDEADYRSDDFYRDLEADRRSAKIVGGIAAGAGVTVIRGGRQ